MFIHNKFKTDELFAEVFDIKQGALEQQQGDSDDQLMHTASPVSVHNCEHREEQVAVRGESFVYEAVAFLWWRWLFVCVFCLNTNNNIIIIIFERLTQTGPKRLHIL